MFNNKKLKRYEYSNNKGITLIALVVTIIVLLILSGITINMAFNPNGILQRASQAKKAQEVAELQDAIQLEAIAYNTAKLDSNQKEPVTVEGTFAKNLKEQGVINNTSDVKKIEHEKDKYYVYTNKGYVFIVSLDSSGQMHVDYVGEDKNMPLDMVVESKTTNSIKVKVYNGNGAEKWVYKYRIEGSSNWTEVKAEHEPYNEFTYTGLKEGKYELMVEAKRDGKKVESTIVKEEVISNIPEPEEGAITIKPQVWDSNTHTASVEFETNTGFTIQYQIGGIEERKWITGNKVTGLKLKQTVYARLWDGANASKKNASVTIEDKGVPTITANKGNTDTNSITVNVTSKDNEAGMPENVKYTYYIKKHSESNYESKATTGASYTFSGLQAKETYDIKVTAKDIAGNEGTGTLTSVITSEMTDPSKVTGAISSTPAVWSNGKASITLSTNTGYTIEYQVGSISGNWTTGKEVTGLSNNSTVYARLFDTAGNRSNYSSIKIEDKKAPTITVTKGSTNTNSIAVNVTSKDNEAGMPKDVQYTYYIKKRSEKDYSTGKQAGASYTFSGLTAKETYDIKVTAKDIAGNEGTGTLNSVITSEMTDPSKVTGAISSTPAVWSNGKASITLSTNTSYSIEYQVGNITEGSWTTGTNVTGLSNNSTVYARLFDTAGNRSNYISVKIEDKISPNQAEIKITNITVEEGQNISATVALSDDESGINVGASKYVLNQTQGSIPDGNINISFADNPQSLIFPARNAGALYLHVLSVDNAGNKMQTASEAIKVKEAGIPETTSYVGKYADVDGNGSIDGIIYADLAVGGNGTWGSTSEGNYTIPTKSDLKKYKIEKTAQTDNRLDETARDVVAPVSGTSGNDRFYIMDLENVGDSTYCWYYSAKNNDRCGMGARGKFTFIWNGKIKYELHDK